MRVRAAHHAELERIHAELLLILKSDLKRAPGIFGREHRILLRFQAGDVRLVPGSIIGKLVIGRELRVGFAIALNLSHLVDGLPAHSRFGVF